MSKRKVADALVGLSINRRRALQAAAYAASAPSLAMALAGCSGGDDAKPDRLSFATFSGPFEKATQASVVPCFEKKTGIKASLVVGTPPANLAKIQADPRNPPMAAYVGLQQTTFQAINAGVVDKLDISKIPNLKDVPEVFTEPFEGYAVPLSLGSWGVFYNKDRIKNPPTSWKEFVERTIAGDYGRTVGFPVVPTYPHIVIWLTAHAYGKKLDEEGISLAFTKFKAMRPNIAKLWSQLTEPGNLMVSGDIAITPLNDGRSYGVIDGGAKELDFRRLEEGAIATTSDLMKVKNASPYAYEFINCNLDPDVQSEFATYFPGYLFSNSKTKYTAESQARLPDRKVLLFPPVRELAAMHSALVERWNKEMAS
jgi:putative spermidine/putrescine transport system substrate-binding protein